MNYEELSSVRVSDGASFNSLARLDNEKEMVGMLDDSCTDCSCDDWSGDCREEGKARLLPDCDIKLLLSSAPSPSLLAASLPGRTGGQLFSPPLGQTQ